MSSTSSRLPWEVHAGLTSDRLTFIARLLTASRHGALATHDRDAGETNWSLGCKALERSMHAILRAATNDNSWLQVIEPKRHFVFLIDGVPVRFFSGAPDGRRRGLLAARAPELAAQQLWLRGTEPSEIDWFWRIAVDVDRATGRVLRVTYYQAFSEKSSAGKPQVVSVRNLWEAPLDDAAGPANDVGQVQPQAVKLAPPRVRRRKKSSQEDSLSTGPEAVKLSEPSPPRKKSSTDENRGHGNGNST